MATIRNLNLDLFHDAYAEKLIIHASYLLTFDVFEVVDENVYSEMLTLYDESESSSTGKKINLDFGTIQVTSSTIERDVDIIIPKDRFEHIDFEKTFSRLNGKISIKVLSDSKYSSQPAPEAEGFVLN